MILESLWEYDHIAMCLIAVAVARKDPELSKTALIYATIIVGFSIFSGEPSEYGRSWYAVCAAIELGIIGLLWGIKSPAAKLVAMASAVNAAVHLSFYAKMWADKELYTSLITTGEYAQTVFIIILSPPVVSMGRRRLSRKKEHTWIARAST